MIDDGQGDCLTLAGAVVSLVAFVIILLSKE
jgi:hypothetical protein